MRVRFLRAARVEYLAEIAFYNEAREGLGLRFASAVEAAVARALAFHWQERLRLPTPGA